MTSATTFNAFATADARTCDAIDSVRHPAVARVADVLRSRSSRPRTVLIDDVENIAQAVRAGVRVIAVYTSATECHRAADLQTVAPSAELHILADALLRSLFGRDKHARIFALVRAPRPASWRDVAARQGDLLVLDGVRIAGNIGAIIRTACAFNAAGVVLLDSGITTAYDRRLIRASRGLMFTIPVLIATASELETFIRSERIPLASMTSEPAQPLSNIAGVDGRIAMLMGSERAGASRMLDALAEHRYTVPMHSPVESLNVSVAAGIALYERRRAAAA
ncbi:TrmH family RNA methyltransferase [Leucobacter sp. NPDC058333]|uniref:TrmH family RNA methyltransferase n=1 Tax=Leucobacter sp. NPDC058333 TaxID=3346450 RepID=UPI00365A795A